MVNRNVIGLVFVVLSFSALAEDGYYTENVTVPSASSFESLAHYIYLYRGETKLAMVGMCFISPSKFHAVCEHSESGEIRLFSPENTKGSFLWKNTEAYPDEVQWHESSGLVYLTKVQGGQFQNVQINMETLVESKR